MDPENLESIETKNVAQSSAKVEKQVQSQRSRLDQWQKTSSRLWRRVVTNCMIAGQLIQNPNVAPTSTSPTSSPPPSPSSSPPSSPPRSPPRSPPSTSRFGLGGAIGPRWPSLSPLSSVLGAALSNTEADLLRTSGEGPSTAESGTHLPSTYEEITFQSSTEFLPPGTSEASQLKSYGENPLSTVPETDLVEIIESLDEVTPQGQRAKHSGLHRPRLLTALVGRSTHEREKEFQMVLEKSPTSSGSFLQLADAPPPPQPPSRHLRLGSHAGQVYGEFSHPVTHRPRLSWRFGGRRNRSPSRTSLGDGRSFYNLRQRFVPLDCFVLLARTALFIVCGTLLVLGSAQAGVGMWLLMSHSRLLHALLGHNVALATLAALTGGGCHVALGGLTGIFSVLAPSCCLILHLGIGASAAAGAVTGVMLEQTYQPEIFNRLEEHMMAEVETAKSHPFYELALHSLHRTFGCCGVHKFIEWCPQTKTLKSTENKVGETKRGKRIAFEISTSTSGNENHSGTPHAQTLNKFAQNNKFIKWNSPPFNLSRDDERFNSGLRMKETTLVTRNSIDQHQMIEESRRKRQNDVDGATLQKKYGDFSEHHLPLSTVQSLLISLIKSGEPQYLDDSPREPVENSKVAEWVRENFPSGPCPLPGSCCVSHRDDSDCTAVPPYKNVYNAGCLKPITALVSAAASIYRSVNITASILLLFSMALALFIHCVIIAEE